jgi:hypothetical protein
VSQSVALKVNLGVTWEELGVVKYGGGNSNESFFGFLKGNN